jgi:hypothetical protein
MGAGNANFLQTSGILIAQPGIREIVRSLRIIEDAYWANLVPQSTKDSLKCPLDNMDDLSLVQ